MDDLEPCEQGGDEPDDLEDLLKTFQSDHYSYERETDVLALLGLGGTTLSPLDEENQTQGRDSIRSMPVGLGHISNDSELPEPPMRRGHAGLDAIGHQLGVTGVFHGEGRWEAQPDMHVGPTCGDRCNHKKTKVHQSKNVKSDSI